MCLSRPWPGVRPKRDQDSALLACTDSRHCWLAGTMCICGVRSRQRPRGGASRGTCPGRQCCSVAPLESAKPAPPSYWPGEPTCTNMRISSQTCRVLHCADEADPGRCPVNPSQATPCRCLRQSGVCAQCCLSFLDALEPVMCLEHGIKGAHSTASPGADTSCQPGHGNIHNTAGPEGHNMAMASTCWPVCLSQTCGREPDLQAG